MSGPRSTLKPVSFTELSVQTRLIQLGDTAVAAREPGAAGGVPGVEAGVGVALGGPAVGVRVGVKVGVDVAAAPVGVRFGVTVAAAAVAVGVDVHVAVGVDVRVGVGVGLEVATNVVAEAVFEYAESPEALVARAL